MRHKPKYLNAPGVGQYAAKRTQAEVAKLLGLTPQRVSQIERIAIGKLRRFLLAGVAACCLLACGGEPFASSSAELGGSPSLGGSAGAAELGGSPPAPTAGGSSSAGKPAAVAGGGAGGSAAVAVDAGAGGELGGAPPASSGPCVTSTWRASAFASWQDEAPGRAVDGDALTRWQSGQAQAPGQWFALELGAPVALEQLDLRNAPGFESDLPAGVGLVLDGKPVASTSSSAGGVLRVAFASTRATSVRLELVGSSSTWWTIYEIGGVCR